MLRVALALGILTAVVAAPSAGAHGTIRMAGGTLAYFSDDAPSASRLEVRGHLAGVSIHDPGVVGGMTAPDVCRPGRTDADGDVVEYTCPGAGLRDLRVDVGPNEDVAVFDVPWTVWADGGSGADELQAAAAGGTLQGDQGNDVLRGGRGADTLRGGAGTDRIEGHDGDDAVEAADGLRDDIACGAGVDRVAADTLDAVGADCEAVQRTAVAPPRSPAGENDARAPALALARGRAGRDRATVRARSSEAGELTASAFLRAGGINMPLRAVTRSARAGRWMGLALRYTRTQRRRVAADLRRGRRPAVRLTVAATDAAGNVRTRALRLGVRR